jgi:hypothetical protein
MIGKDTKSSGSAKDREMGDGQCWFCVVVDRYLSWQIPASSRVAIVSFLLTWIPVWTKQPCLYQILHLNSGQHSCHNSGIKMVLWLLTALHDNDKQYSHPWAVAGAGHMTPSSSKGSWVGPRSKVEPGARIQVDLGSALLGISMKSG